MSYSASSSKISIFDYYFVLRPMLHFPGWSTMLAGYFIPEKGQLYFNLRQIISLDYIEIVLIIFILMTAMGAAAIVNQLQDVISDRHNKKLFLISDGFIQTKNATIEAVILASVSLFLAFIFKTSVGWLILISLFIAGYAYNYRPLRLKDNPMTSLIANSLMGWLVFAIGWASRHEISWQLVTDSMPYFFFNGALYFYTTLPDIAGDKKSAKRTYAVLLGVKPILRIAFVFYLIGLFSAVYLNDYLAMTFCLLSFPFFLITLIKNDLPSAVRTTKYSILFVAAAICFKFPIYLIPMISIFFFTRWYFRARFDYDYPNFSG